MCNHNLCNSIILINKKTWANDVRHTGNNTGSVKSTQVNMLSGRSTELKMQFTKLTSSISSGLPPLRQICAVAFG